MDPFGFAILVGSVALSGLNGVVLQVQLQRGRSSLGRPALTNSRASESGTNDGQGEIAMATVHPIVLTWEIAPWAALTALAFGPRMHSVMSLAIHVWWS